MRIVVIGAGAIGGATAAYMAMGGIDVTLVCKRRTVSDAIRESGLHIIGKRGEQSIKLDAVADMAELAEHSGLFDYCLIATKAYDLEAAAQGILPYLTPSAPVVSLQNGICLDKLIHAVGPERAVGGVVSWSCTMLDDARLEITGEGGFVIGMAAVGGPRQGERVDLHQVETTDPRLTELKQAMDLMAPTRITTDILSELYSKLIINSGITCGGAMTGQTLGQMLKGSLARRFFIRIVREDMAVARAMGLKVPPFGGKLDYDAFIKGSSLADAARRHAILFIVGLKYRKLKSSSLTSLLRGGKTEVETLNGWISEKGRELGIPTPVNDRVVEIIREIESGKRKISPENLREV